MRVDLYNLHCSNCSPSRFVEVDADDVTITADLRTDEYIFYHGCCPKCGKEIVNKRKAF